MKYSTFCKKYGDGYEATGTTFFPPDIIKKEGQKVYNHYTSNIGLIVENDIIIGYISHPKIPLINYLENNNLSEDFFEIEPTVIEDFSKDMYIWKTKDEYMLFFIPGFKSSDTIYTYTVYQLILLRDLDQFEYFSNN